MCARVQTAMIIDDDVDFCKLLSLVLQKRKIHVLAVHTLKEAEDYLAYLKPSVVFLDNSFPEGLGINFIKNIHAADPDIKIVMATGDTALWIHEKAMNEGINHFLQKPVSRQSLDAVLDDMRFRREQA